MQDIFLALQPLTTHSNIGFDLLVASCTFNQPICLAKASEQLYIENPNPFDDLWKWHGRWRDIKTYAERRSFLADMYMPVLNLLQDSEHGSSLDITVDLTGWDRVK